MRIEGNKNLRSSQQGFTITEVLMVLILILIVAGIGFATFNRMAINLSLRTAARDIASDCQLARQRAMAENTPLTITFDPGNHTYTVPTPGGGTQIKALANYRGGVTINSTDIPGAAVVFMPRGTTQQVGTVVLINTRASTATININSTGRANVTFAMQ